MPTQTSMLHIQVGCSCATETQATHALAAMGLAMPDAVRLFLRRVVVDRTLPLELKTQNAATRAADCAILFP